MAAFDDEIESALAEIQEECGRQVRLRTGVITRVITAVAAETRTEVTTFQQARLHVANRDYLIVASTYGQEPQPGDEIEDAGRMYEVTRLDDKVPCWEWSDRGHTTYRVHTTETGPV